MEFRNHQNWVRHHYRDIVRGPFSFVAFLLLGVIAVAVLIAIAFVTVVVLAVLLPLRLLSSALAGGRRSGSVPGRTATTLGAGPVREREDGGPPGEGTVINVQVTRSEPR